MTNFIEFFSVGFGLAFSLILAIGAQNAFVLRTGLLGRHVFAVCCFCALSDILLITVGINGMGALLAPLQQHIFWVYILAALWLGGYGLLRLRDAASGKSALNANQQEGQSLAAVMTVIAGLTWLNPHVYLDTVILLGGISSTVPSDSKISFSLGSYSASVIFFFGLGYGAKRLGRSLTNPKIWTRIDIGIAMIMFWIASGLLWAAVRS